MARVTSNPASVNFENDSIVDSSCGYHVTGDASKFSRFHPYQGKYAIVTADNTVHYMEKEVVINGSKDNSITLNDVHHVPGTTKNLFPVSNAADAGNYVLLGPKDVKFLRNIDDLEADVVHIGKRVNNVSWIHAKNYNSTAYVINRVPLSPINLKSPYELMFNEKPSVKHFRIFGSICYVHVPDAQRNKFDAKTRKCIFIGYDNQKKGWKCMDPLTHRYVVLRDVVFDEILSHYDSNKIMEPEITIFLSTLILLFHKKIIVKGGALVHVKNIKEKMVLDCSLVSVTNGKM
ncbi:hypothetical protein L6164_001142 [Bauhinia variegata]|uniref:Uncharacterized protein n=1 Tax=Bauhinia variegata TaxID=167791 RepID=A0ACB9Q8K8_BAUVA|nr:hypothetical protein L6164_001142 [Bauhinia variegata]